MIFLRQSTASQIVALGPFVDSTDGNTAETGLTIANTDIKIQKYGGTTLSNKNSGGATHISNGNYYATFDATDTNTCGTTKIVVQVSGALPVFLDAMVVPAMIFDALFLGTDRLDANVTHVADTSQTARDIGASVLLSSGTGTGQLDFTSGVVKANVTQFGSSNGTFASGRPEVNTSHIAGSAVSASSAQIGVNLVNIAGSAVNTSSAQLGVNIVNAAGTGWTSGAIVAGTFAADSITAAKIADGAIDTATFATGTTIPRCTLVDTTTTNTDMITAAGIRTAVGLASANLDTQLTTIDDFLDTEIAAIKAKTDQLVFTTANRVDASALSIANNAITSSVIATDAITSTGLAASAVAEIVSGLSIPTAADIADAVMDENMGAHSTADTLGWLVHRFGSTTTKSSTQIKVYNTAAGLISTQAISESGLNQTQGPTT